MKLKPTIQQLISMYGIGTRVLTPDGPGTIKAIYNYRCLIMVDDEYRQKSRFGLPAERLPFPTEYWNHERPFDFHGSLYAFDELKLILRKWNTLRPEEIEAIDWDNQSIYWAKKSKKGVIKYDEVAPQCLRPAEYLFFCNLKIDVFDLYKDSIAVEEPIKILS